MEHSSASSETSPGSSDFDPRQLVERYQVGLWRFLRSLGCESSLADDLVQDTFVTVLQKPFTHFGEAASASYLRKIAMNLFISFKRREGKVVAAENIEAICDAWQEWMVDDSGDELVSTLTECLKGLTDRARWALQMRFRDKFARAEIARNLKITEHGAKNLMQRAKKQLRDCIDSKSDLQTNDQKPDGDNENARPEK